MFNKKLLLSALVLVSLAGVASCSTPDTGDDFEQNTSSYVAPEETMYLVGSHWNGWWDDAHKVAPTDGTKFIRSTEDTNVYYIDVEVTADMADAWVGFKFTATPGWDVQYGLEDVSFEDCNAAFLAAIKCQDKTTLTGPSSNRSNVELVDGAAKVGTYHIEYRPYNLKFEEVDGEAGTYTHKFTIDFTPAA